MKTENTTIQDLAVSLGVYPPKQPEVSRSFCIYCDFPEATQEDWDTIPEGEGDHLCWGDCFKDAEASLRRVFAERNAFRASLEDINTSAMHCPSEFCRNIKTALADATELLAEIMRDEVNHQDEAEKWLRAYAPQHLFPESKEPPMSNQLKSFTGVDETACSRLAEYLESPPPYRKHVTKERLWLVLDSHGDSLLWSDQELAVDAAVESLNYMAGINTDQPS